jgi:hypothetical protein
VGDAIAAIEQCMQLPITVTKPAATTSSADITVASASASTTTSVAAAAADASPFVDFVVNLDDLDGELNLNQEDGGSIGGLGYLDTESPLLAPLRPIDIRRARRLEAEERKLRKKKSVFKALDAVLRARQVATPRPDADMVGPIEYIKGTDRIYTKEELILPLNPKPEEVKVCNIT